MNCCQILLFLITLFLFIGVFAFHFCAKKQNNNKHIKYAKILYVVLVVLSLFSCIILYIKLKDETYLYELYCLLFVYIFFANTIIFDISYDILFKNFVGKIVVILLLEIIAYFITFSCETFFEMISNTVLRKMCIPTLICILSYAIYIICTATNLQKKEYYYSFFITFVTFYINIIAIVYLFKNRITKDDGYVFNAVIVLLGLLMNFIDKSDNISQYFFDIKGKECNNIN